MNLFTSCPHAIHRSKKVAGFTIVELLIVIVVIAILAAISIVSYNGIQARARAVSMQSSIEQAYKLIELYYAENGEYPKTTTETLASGGDRVTFTDENCSRGTKQADWIPGVGALPQSDQAIKGARGVGGCFMYISDGTSYVLSAWNLLESPQTSTMYRRLGFREMDQTAQFYICNHPNIGGAGVTAYAASRDYYKHSYTISNITSCNETPPAGA
ncbi:MAG: prepilin-type N-terminal cleavage/methylation domain-containing protein [Candidatus Saccharimonas sp.]